MSWENDIYYNPEKHGLTTVAEISWVSEPYEFDLTVIWRRITDGQLFIASDSGCSCPSPFERYESVDDLEPVTKFEAVAALQRRQAETSEYAIDTPTADRIAKVAAYLMSH